MALIKKNTTPAIADDGRNQPRDRDSLLVQLDEPDASARRWAARDLQAFPHAAAGLVARLKIEPDLSVRQVLLTSLTRIGNETAVAGLVSCLRSDDAPLRNEAIEAMKALPAEVAALMGALLHDPDADVRILSVNVLESLCHPDVESWLIDVIDGDQEVNVCATAVDLLGEVGSPAAQDALQRLKRRFASEPYIQFAADLALKRIATA